MKDTTSKREEMKLNPEIEKAIIRMSKADKRNNFFDWFTPRVLELLYRGDDFIDFDIKDQTGYKPSGIYLGVKGSNRMLLIDMEQQGFIVQCQSHYTNEKGVYCITHLGATVLKAVRKLI